MALDARDGKGNLNFQGPSLFVGQNSANGNLGFCDCLN